MKVFIKDNFCTIYKLKVHQLQNFLISNGISIVNEGCKADLVISGVCAAFNADEERSQEIISKNSSYKVPHYVIGCMVSVNPDRVVSDYSYRTWEFDKLAGDITGVSTSLYDETPLPSIFRSKNDYRIFNNKRRFIGVTTGCGFDCSYCPHRVGAGLVKSRSPHQIINDVISAVEEGGTIIHLTGLDTASYGLDNGISFGELLLNILSTVKHNIAFHIAQFNPAGLMARGAFDKLVKACSDQRIVDFQLPVQTASKRLLKLMNREYDFSLVSKFVDKIKTNNPSIFFRTDIMVGFPSERELDIEETDHFVSNIFNEAAVYLYERKEGLPISVSSRDIEIPFFEKEKRMHYVLSRLKENGVLVHSGGQDISSLLQADKKKCMQEMDL